MVACKWVRAAACVCLGLSWCWLARAHDGEQLVDVGVLQVERRNAPVVPVRESRHHGGSGEILLFGRGLVADSDRNTQGKRDSVAP